MTSHDLPINSKIVYEGILFDTIQWEQKLYNGSTKTFEMIRRKPSVDIIAVQDGMILILEQEQPTKPVFPSLPGGRIDKGEKPINAAHRELLEETGYVANQISLFGEFFGLSKIHYHQSVFIAKDMELKSEQNLDGGEKISIKFVTFNSFLNLCRVPNFNAPIELKFEMYEALVNDSKKRVLRKLIFES